jgi:hypothetical protein
VPFWNSLGEFCLNSLLVKLLALFYRGTALSGGNTIVWERTVSRVCPVTSAVLEASIREHERCQTGTSPELLAIRMHPLEEVPGLVEQRFHLHRFRDEDIRLGVAAP